MSESERRIWGGTEAEDALTDRQLQLVEHYRDLGDLEPTDRDLRLASLSERRGKRNLQRLQSEAAKQDEQATNDAWAELAAANPNNPEVLTYSNEEGEA